MNFDKIHIIQFSLLLKRNSETTVVRFKTYHLWHTPSSVTHPFLCPLRASHPLHHMLDSRSYLQIIRELWVFNSCMGSFPTYAWSLCMIYKVAYTLPLSGHLQRFFISSSSTSILQFGLNSRLWSSSKKILLFNIINSQLMQRVRWGLEVEKGLS